MILVTGCRQAPASIHTPTAELPPGNPTQKAPSAETITPETSPANNPSIPVFSFKGIEFSYDDQTLGPIGTTQHLPPVAPGESPVQPERLEIRLNSAGDGTGPVMTIFPVDQYRALSADAAEEITALRELLIQRPESSPATLPLLPMHQALESYHSDPNYIDFQNGSGISYLAKADHDRSLATEETFFYTFQGLTDDGRFYVTTFIPLIGTDADGNGEVKNSTQNEISSEHQSKPALASSWIGVDVGEGFSLVDDIMMSLLVAPDDAFPAIKLPDYETSQGIVLGYDAQVSGAVSTERVPAVIENRDGSIEFLHDIPDMVALAFSGSDYSPGGAELQIQAVRNTEGEFYEAIPSWQLDQISVLEAGDQVLFEQLLDDSSISQLDDLQFQNGTGFRWFGNRDSDVVTANSNHEEAYPTYFFNGISGDGKYVVQFSHVIPLSMSEAEALSYLDSVIGSILVAPNATTGSSIPLDPEDCENNAEFVEDISIPDYAVVERGDVFVKIWRIRNSGSCTWTPAYQIDHAQGNPVEWQNVAITEVVSPGEETEVGVTVHSPTAPGIYQAWWQLIDESGERFGDMLELLFESPRPATDIPGYGVIEGDINYPANGNPAIDIYFQRTDGSERYVMQTERGWTRYSNAVPVGTYFVFARVAGDSGNSGGGYTEAVICGLHADCKDHSLVEVVVDEGVATRNVNIFDWYAPAGSFPLPEPPTEQVDTTEGT